MSEMSQVQIPSNFLGTEVPDDLRRSLDLHARFLDESEAKSLIAAALASWMISTMGQEHSLR
ncbi:hypothetical protein U8326_00470 [Tsuneonella sp. CC-YZS046]|uniref:hypothetical protein n=1 Tax=Tsuneonella sp. CC-YZS046 TaxID=3042152 RepID=UPI002D786FD5|nr:hypothetical protein [Tsuneonella sp. CC-YZS046]WRO66674.1 hypothetical protein U8326_00470 [Tsuneonella sp. CC-YZS046]